jgi:uracil-DNA glycosylase family 4
MGVGPQWRKEMEACRSCSLEGGRTRVVRGVGPLPARWMATGEGPGEQEDRTGLPFVHVAGELLDRMFVSLGLDRTEVFVVNTVRCRPPKNRDPLVDEVRTCTLRWLLPELRAVAPEVVFLFGSTPSRAWLGEPIGKTRGKLWRLPGWDPLFYPLVHPAAHAHATGPQAASLRQTAREDLARWARWREAVDRKETTWAELATLRTSGPTWAPCTDVEVDPTA